MLHEIFDSWIFGTVISIATITAVAVVLYNYAFHRENIKHTVQIAATGFVVAIFVAGSLGYESVDRYSAATAYFEERNIHFALVNRHNDLPPLFVGTFAQCEEFLEHLRELVITYSHTCEISKDVVSPELISNSDQQRNPYYSNPK